jgi:hypothetical protein
LSHRLKRSTGEFSVFLGHLASIALNTSFGAMGTTHWVIPVAPLVFPPASFYRLTLGPDLRRARLKDRLRGPLPITAPSLGLCGPKSLIDPLVTLSASGGGHCVRGERAADDRADATAPLMGTWVSQGAPLVNASLPAASATSAFIAAFSWQSLAGGVMIAAEVGHLTIRVGEIRVPKYGGLMTARRND